MPSILGERQEAMLALLTNVGELIGYILLAILTITIVFFTLILLISLLGKLGKRIKPNSQKVILITGGSSGIGQAVAKHLFKLGFSVIVGHYNDREPGYQELVELSIQSKKARDEQADESVVSMTQSHLFLVPMDVTSQASVEDADVTITKLLEEHDLQLYALINNAGVWLESSFEWSSKESIKKSIDTNLYGLMLVTRQFVSKIIASKGKLIHLSSLVSRYPVAGVSVYGATKSAIGFFSDAVGEDLRDYGVVSVSVHPSDLMSNSNIMITRAKSAQESIEELSPEERELYKKSIDRHGRFINSVLHRKFIGSNEEPATLESVFESNTPQMVRRKSCWSRFLDWQFGFL